MQSNVHTAPARCDFDEVVRRLDVHPMTGSVHPQSRSETVVMLDC